MYLEEGEAHDNVVASRYHVGLGIEEHAPDFSPPTSAEDSFRNGMKFFSRLQTDDGHWAGDYGGPMFLLPGYAIVHHICGVTVPEENRREIVRYLSNLQAEDGGWGIHIESQSTVFGTTLNYVVMRLFGVPRDDLRMVKARGWLETRGGCLGIPSWGKFWLATLGVFSWDGCNSLFPEMVLLPQWFPLHTRRLWSYCRTVYMSMSYISGQRFTGPMSDVVRDLREELIFQPFDSVDWAAARNRIAEEDLWVAERAAVFLSALSSLPDHPPYRALCSCLPGSAVHCRCCLYILPCFFLAFAATLRIQGCSTCSIPSATRTKGWLQRGFARQLWSGCTSVGSQRRTSSRTTSTSVGHGIVVSGLQRGLHVLSTPSFPSLCEASRRPWYHLTLTVCRPGEQDDQHARSVCP